MPSANIALADAVAAQLNAAGLGFTTAARKLRCEHKVEELATLRISVLPSGDDGDREDRDVFRHEMRVAVLIQQRVDPANEEAQGATLIELGEKIVGLYENEDTAPPLADYEFQRSEYAPFFNREHLKTSSVFTLSVELVFWSWR